MVGEWHGRLGRDHAQDARATVKLLLRHLMRGVVSQSEREKLLQ